MEWFKIQAEMGYVCSELDCSGSHEGKPEWSGFRFRLEWAMFALSLIVQGARRANLSGVVLDSGLNGLCLLRSLICQGAMRANLSGLVFDSG